MTIVYRIRPWTAGDRETMAERLLAHLYGSFVPVIGSGSHSERQGPVVLRDRSGNYGQPAFEELKPRVGRQAFGPISGAVSDAGTSAR